MIFEMNTSVNPETGMNQQFLNAHNRGANSLVHAA